MLSKLPSPFSRAFLHSGWHWRDLHLHFSQTKLYADQCDLPLWTRVCFTLACLCLLFPIIGCCFKWSPPGCHVFFFCICVGSCLYLLCTQARPSCLVWWFLVLIANRFCPLLCFIKSSAGCSLLEPDGQDQKGSTAALISSSRFLLDNILKAQVSVSLFFLAFLLYKKRHFTAHTGNRASPAIFYNTLGAVLVQWCVIVPYFKPQVIKHWLVRTAKTWLSGQ